MTDSIAILGAGLCGNLLAILLSRLDFEVTVYERDPEIVSRTAGRSINLALAARGIRALRAAGAYDAVFPLLLPMRGRIVHDRDGNCRFLSYGQNEDECIWSVSRFELNRKLIRIAREQHGVTYRFEHACIEFDPSELIATIRSGDRDFTIRSDLLLAADGAGSIVRRRLASSQAVTASEDLLDHGYKELTIPATRDDEFAFSPEGLHIWPRGGFMLIALPNLDRSFTATLFLPQQGDPSFASISKSNIGEFFEQEFNDVSGMIFDLAHEFDAHPVGTLGTVHCMPWSLTQAGKASPTALLVGDAAHAIVPFHGQGMNAAFEDCAELASIAKASAPNWRLVATQFEESRRDNTRAIAEMALENYAEMRDTVRDPDFERRAALSFELERRHAGRFIPRYSMVMFHPEIAYAEAQRRGRIQAAILDEALSAPDEAAQLALASKLVEKKL